MAYNETNNLDVFVKKNSAVQKENMKSSQYAVAAEGVSINKSYINTIQQLERNIDCLHSKTSHLVNDPSPLLASYCTSPRGTLGEIDHHSVISSASNDSDSIGNNEGGDGCHNKPFISHNNDNLKLFHSSKLRSGKWTIEEETFASHIVSYFRLGLIELKQGTTLRIYLSEKLHCCPMRVTKKFCTVTKKGFEGQGPIGKQSFKLSESCGDMESSHWHEIKQAKQHLKILEYLFHCSLTKTLSEANIIKLQTMHQVQEENLRKNHEYEKDCLHKKFALSGF